MGETVYTQQVKSLIDKVYVLGPQRDSVLSRVQNFYENQFYVSQQKNELVCRLDDLEENLANCKRKDARDLELRVKQVKGEKQDLDERQAFECQERYIFLDTICEQVLELTEANEFTETNRKSAQFLGSLQLLTPTEGKRVAERNELVKPLYRAVLALRLLDGLCLTKSINEPYIKQYLGDITPETYQKFAAEDAEQYHEFVQHVKKPILMLAIIMEIGNYHPDAVQIINGIDGLKDPSRNLEAQERKERLQICFRETTKFLVDGIGIPKYVGNSRPERDAFHENEQKKLTFLKQLYKASVNPKNGIGNLLKVPQIYTSIIFSTKATYNYKLLPKVYQVLDQNAEKGSCNQAVVNILRRITGIFPQGYGVTYIPLDSEGDPLDRYEYAIVNQLYPEKPETPGCKMATRQLAFISSGHDFTVEIKQNLYYPETGKTLANISKKRLMEILEKLSSNYKEREHLDLIPRCWHPNDYFSLKQNQKLWNKASL